MTSQTTPKTPVENWETIRDEWIAAVEELVGNVEAWCADQGWATLRESKTIEENRLGAYRVPRLLIHASFGRAVMDPIARYVVGARGLVELAELPSYDSLAVARPLEGEGWFLQESDSAGSRRPWNKENFVATVQSFRIAS